ncbi:MAG: hypothetical protein N2506_00215 [Dehalococcoidales bacterium]|nr:hypothetical protein [Dehalococcoidales bacterium]
MREHRFVVVFRGSGLDADLTESDPSRTGMSPLEIRALSSGSERLARIARHFVEKARDVLGGQKQANMILLRGFSRKPRLPTMQEIYRLNPLVIAVYPMYRGLARLVGMEVVPAGNSLKDEVGALEENYARYDFFFLHVKWTDTAGEDGDFARKVRVLEEIDAVLPRVINLRPDVLVITGDHSTPAVLRGHSWHPVPVLLCSRYCRRDGVSKFSESAFASGGLGRIPAVEIMGLAMAYALKLTKYGA